MYALSYYLKFNEHVLPAFNKNKQKKTANKQGSF